MTEPAECHHLRREPYTGDNFHPMAARDSSKWFRCLDCGTIYQEPVTTDAAKTPAIEAN